MQAVASLCSDGSLSCSCLSDVTAWKSCTLLMACRHISDCYAGNNMLQSATFFVWALSCTHAPTSPGHLSLYIIFSETSYIYCLPLQAHTDELQAALIKAERAILYIIDFEMRIQHPYKIALELTKPPAFNLQKHSIAASNGRYVDITTAIFNVANARYEPNAPPLALKHVCLWPQVPIFALWYSPACRTGSSCTAHKQSSVLHMQSTTACPSQLYCVC